MMKLTVTRKEFHDGLQIVSRIVATHTTMPVLKNILIEPGADSVKLAATDFDLSIEVLVPATVHEGGPITVPARTLSEIVAELPAADISLSADEQSNLLIACRRSEYRIHGLSAEDFPAPAVGGRVSFVIAQPLFKEMIRQTHFAASANDTRPILTGVSMVLEEEGSLRLAATDTNRLAVRTEKVTESTGRCTVIVPVRALKELMRVLGDGEKSTVSVRVDRNRVLFRTDTATLISRLIEGQSPDYQRVVPTSHTHRLTIGREELQSALRRARIVARNAQERNRVVLAAYGKILAVTAQGDFGDAREEMEIVREGGEIEAAYDIHYLLDGVGALVSEELVLDLTEPLKQAVIRPTDGSDCLMVIMPMQVQ